MPYKRSEADSNLRRWCYGPKTQNPKGSNLLSWNLRSAKSSRQFQFMTPHGDCDPLRNGVLKFVASSITESNVLIYCFSRSFNKATDGTEFFRELGPRPMRSFSVPKASNPALVAFRVSPGPGTWTAHIFEDSKFLGWRNSSSTSFSRPCTQIPPSSRWVFVAGAPRAIRKLVSLCRFNGAAHYSSGSNGRSPAGRKKDPSLLYGAGWESGGEDVPVAVWWDCENCNVPQGIEVYRVGINIVSGLRLSGFKGTVSISAYGDTLQLSRSTQEALASTGIRLHHVPSGGKDSSDRALLVDLLLWTFDHPPPAHLFLISGDRDFSNALHRLRMRNYNILLACPHGTTVSPALLGAATHVWQWNSLVRGEGLLLASPPDGSSGGGPYSRHGGPRPYSPSYSPLPRAYDGNGFSSDGGMTSGQVQTMPDEGSSIFNAKIPDATPVSVSQSSQNETLKDSAQAAAGAPEGVGEGSSAKPVLRQPPKKVLQQLKCLLQSHPEGATLSDLQNYIREGKVTFEKDFYGHGKVVPFLSSVPEIVRLERVLMKDNRSWSYNLFLNEETQTGAKGGGVQPPPSRQVGTKASVAPVTSSQSGMRGQDSKSSPNQALSSSESVPSEERVAESSDGKPDIRQPPKTVLQQFRCLLKSHPNGMMLSDLQNYIREGRVSFEKDFYGHRKVVPFLSSIPEIVRLQRILMKDNKSWSYKLFLSQETPKVMPAVSVNQGKLETAGTESSPVSLVDQEQDKVLSSDGLTHLEETAATYPQSTQAEGLDKDHKEGSLQADGIISDVPPSTLDSGRTSDLSVKGTSLPTFLGSIVNALRNWRGKSPAVEDTGLPEQVDSKLEDKDIHLEEVDGGKPGSTEYAARGADINRVSAVGGTEADVKEGIEGLFSEIRFTGKQPLSEVAREVEKAECELLPEGSSESTQSIVSPVVEEEKPTWKAWLFGAKKEEPKIRAPSSEVSDQRLLQFRGSHGDGVHDMKVLEELEEYVNSAECTLLLSNASNITEAVNLIKTKGRAQFQRLSSEEILGVLGPSAEAKGVSCEFLHESVSHGGSVSVPVGSQGRDAIGNLYESKDSAVSGTQAQSADISVSKGTGSGVQREQETDSNARDKRDSVDELFEDQPGPRSTVTSESSPISCQQHSGVVTSLSTSTPAVMETKHAYPTFEELEAWFLGVVNNAFKRSARIQEVGYDLSLVKPDFEREFRVRLDPKLYGFTRVQDLVASIPSVRLSKPRVDQCTIYLQKEAVLEPTDQDMEEQMKCPKGSFNTRLLYWPRMYHDCKSLVRELMLEIPEGLPGSKLKPLFASRFNYPLDHKRFGCQRMSDLLRLMPDIVSVNGNLLVPSEEFRRTMKKQPTTTKMVTQIEKLDADNGIFSEAGSEREENWSEIDKEANGCPSFEEVNGDKTELSSSWRQEVSSDDESDFAEIDSQAEEVLDKEEQKTTSEEEDEMSGHTRNPRSSKDYDFSEEIDELLLEDDDVENWLEENQIDQQYAVTADPNEESLRKDAPPILDGHLSEDWAAELAKEENQYSSDLLCDEHKSYSYSTGLYQEEETLETVDTHTKGPGRPENMGYISDPSLAEDSKTEAQDHNAARKAEGSSESGRLAERGEGTDCNGRSS
ncbi:hypothetical protein R1flu_013068 [Riccia fluitans]|uniref:HTH OST-type domain-containing protein n=1 Tax=Riccia fluitans TaxID=41844 RepID=A0ABD1ZCQ8_9MARC